jgi:ATP-dependent exoDNAse (exonuclease V) alpha subunit
VGDDRQIGSVERGGIYADMVANIGSAELSTVRRQERHWARAAARAFSDYRFLDGLEAYAERGLIHWAATLDDSRAALLARYEQDTREGAGSRFIFAYTNDECRKLNHGVQEIDIARGRVTNLHIFETERGMLRVGEGDRLAFRGTDKRRGLLNGAIATVEKIDGGHLTVRTDRGKLISFPINEFSNVELGYSGSIYRGQGKTLDEVYLFHTSHWRDAASYVALTRSRKSTHIFVARDQAQDVCELARQMDRQGQRGSTLQYSTTTEFQRERDLIAANISEMGPAASSRRREGRSNRRREHRRVADRDREQEL